MDNFDWRYSSNAIAATTPMMRTANTPVPARKMISSGRILVVCLLEITAGHSVVVAGKTAALLRSSGTESAHAGYQDASLGLDLVQRLHFHLDHRLRQRRVSEVRRKLLSVGQRPLQEVDHRLGLLLVLRVLVEQQPGKRGDRIDV